MQKSHDTLFKFKFMLAWCIFLARMFAFSDAKNETFIYLVKKAFCSRLTDIFLNLKQEKIIRIWTFFHLKYQRRNGRIWSQSILTNFTRLTVMKSIDSYIIKLKWRLIRIATAVVLCCWNWICVNATGDRPIEYD